VAGFPVRPSRAAFGPKPIDRFPVRDPARYGAANLFDLLYWQVAGLGVAGHVGFVTLTSDGTNLSIVSSGEAWDPDGGSQPTYSRSAAGTYAIQYAASYLDKDGNTVTTNLLGCIVIPQTLISGNSARVTSKVNADKRTVDIRYRNNADSLADTPTGDGLILVVF
jgi:hypothetical protein